MPRMHNILSEKKEDELSKRSQGNSMLFNPFDYLLSAGVSINAIFTVWTAQTKFYLMMRCEASFSNSSKLKFKLQFKKKYVCIHRYFVFPKWWDIWGENQPVEKQNSHRLDGINKTEIWITLKILELNTSIELISNCWFCERIVAIQIVAHSTNNSLLSDWSILNIYLINLRVPNVWSLLL